MLHFIEKNYAAKFSFYVSGFVRFIIQQRLFSLSTPYS